MAKGIIYSKPASKAEAEDPEILIQGFGRMMLSQLKKRVIRDHENMTRFLKTGNYESYMAVAKNQNEFIEALNDVMAVISSPKYKKMKGRLREEPANVVGSGNIAGLGVGASGEPGLTPAQQKRYKRKNFTRFINKGE